MLGTILYHQGDTNPELRSNYRVIPVRSTLFQTEMQFNLFFKYEETWYGIGQIDSTRRWNLTLICQQGRTHSLAMDNTDTEALSKD